MTAARAYLERFQTEFSAVLRQPLERASGTLRARTEAYPEALRDGVRDAGMDPAERLAVYNRQYWFRLFTVLQNEHRLTTALVGAWGFNRLAERYLLAEPPTGHDLADIADGFGPFTTAYAIDDAGIPADALVDAIAIDVAFRRAARAPHEAPLRLAHADDRLMRARLVRSRSFTLLAERRPLVAVRHELPMPLGEHRAAVPPPYPDSPRRWIVCRAPDGLLAKPIAPANAALLHLLAEHPIGEALARLEEAFPGDAVAGEAQRWFADGVKLGFWTGVEAAP